MKRTVTLLFSLVAAWAIFAPTAKAQVLNQGNVIIDPYYGFPNLMTTFFRAIADANTNDPNLKVGGVGPFGGRVQFMVSDKIGVGLDSYFASSYFEYTDIGVDSLGNTHSYTYRLSNPRPRFLLRADFHFGNSEMVDPYFAVGLGYSAARYKFTTNDPLFDEDTYETRNLLPIAYRLAFGTKVYFVKFLGAGVEVGLGGPLVTIGLSTKF